MQGSGPSSLAPAYLSSLINFFITTLPLPDPSALTIWNKWLHKEPRTRQKGSSKDKSTAQDKKQRL